MVRNLTFSRFCNNFDGLLAFEKTIENILLNPIERQVCLNGLKKYAIFIT